MKWLKRLFKKEPEVWDDSTREWSWECLHKGCRLAGTGTQAEVRQESMVHLMTSGHTVKGGEM